MRELILEGPLLRKRRVKKLILIGVDACLITVSYLLAILFRYYMEGSSVNENLMRGGKSYSCKPATGIVCVRVIVFVCFSCLLDALLNMSKHS